MSWKVSTQRNGIRQGIYNLPNSFVQLLLLLLFLKVDGDHDLEGFEILVGFT